MKKSTFKDGSICYGVDYSNRNDISVVEDISMEQFISETTPIEDITSWEAIIS